MVTHTKAKDFICSICAKGFSLEQNMQRHMKIHDGVKPYQCSFCEKSFTQSGSCKDHEARVHTGNLPHACKLCDAKFATLAPLQRHNFQHHGAEKPFKCEECGKGFISRPELANHLRTHSGEKPFDCEKCGQHFASPSGLRAHKVKHEIEEGTISPEKLQRIEDKRMDCEVCGKPFYNQSNYDRHMKGHKGIKEFQCNQCGKAYTSKRSLEQHIDVIHLGKKSFVCNICNQSFGRTTTLRVHMLSHTKELPFRCEYCSAGYKEKRNLKKHMMKSHPEIEQTDLWQSHYLTLKDESGSTDDGERSMMENQDENQNVGWMGHNVQDEELAIKHPDGQGLKKDLDQLTNSSYKGSILFPGSNEPIRNVGTQEVDKDLNKIPSFPLVSEASRSDSNYPKDRKEKAMSTPTGDFIGAPHPQPTRKPGQQLSNSTFPGASPSLTRDSTPVSESLRGGPTANSDSREDSAKIPASDFTGASFPKVREGHERSYNQPANNAVFPQSSAMFRGYPTHPHLNDLTREVAAGVTSSGFRGTSFPSVHNFTEAFKRNQDQVNGSGNFSGSSFERETTSTGEGRGAALRMPTSDLRSTSPKYHLGEDFKRHPD